MYFQAGYAFEHVEFFAGAGNGWHTSDGEFAVCNVGIGTGKTIKITENFSVAVSGQVYSESREGTILSGGRFFTVK